MEVTFEDGLASKEEWTVEQFFPTGLRYNLPTSDQVLLSIDQVEETEGTNLVFHFGTDPQEASYQFQIEAFYATAQEEGSTYVSTATLYQGDSEIATASCQVVYDTPLDITVSEDTQYYTLVDEPYQLKHFFKNSANRALTDFQVTLSYAPYYNVTQIKATCSAKEFASYQVFLKTSDNPDTLVEIAHCTTSATGILDLTPYLTGENKVTHIILLADEVTSSSSTSTSQIWTYGTITSEDSEDTATAFLLTAESEQGWVRGKMSTSYLLREASRLTVEGSFPNHVDAFDPEEEVYCQMLAPENSDWRRNPIFIQHLPVGVDYLPENSYYLYTDGFQETSYDSREDGFPVPLPEVTVLNDVEEVGRTLVRHDFTGFVLQGFNTLAVRSGENQSGRR